MATVLWSTLRGGRKGEFYGKAAFCAWKRHKSASSVHYSISHHHNMSFLLPAPVQNVDAFNWFALIDHCLILPNWSVLNGMLFRSKYQRTQLRSLVYTVKSLYASFVKRCLEHKLERRCSVLVRPSPPAEPDLCTVQHLLPHLLLHVQRTIILNDKQNTRTHMTFGVNQPVIDDMSDDL